MAVAAARGVQWARDELTPRPVPECVAYLEEWLYQLHGRSGMHQYGIAPLSYSTIAAWAELQGVDLTPWEVDTLLALDAALLVGAQEDPKPKGR